ncbi:lipid IV(A) 3-deoxy-D-manno-octulosonic acid transferase [Aliikangiella maris]|uniref:Lipid IV(A) 3-deoxy-D-manno-octulosonic acid transferase n=2 Tax=Aliikangiella maris TaxID=3162458 RepID=A0ABV3MMY5_9GAMM
MSRLVYCLLLYLISPLIWGYLLFRAVKAPEYREGILARLGLNTRNAARHGIIIHCASVGETIAAAPLIRRLLVDFSHLPLVVTTTTPTGKAMVRQLFGEQVFHHYLPVDWPGASGRFIRTLKPQLVILMETEVWPNLLFQCQQQSVPVLLANARLSSKSLSSYLKFARFSRQIFSRIQVIAAQYTSDVENFKQLCNSAKTCIEATGSIKFDIAISPDTLALQKSLTAQWTISERRVWVAASIHPGEFSTILTVHQQLLKQFPDLLLIGVPRHPEQFIPFKQMVKTFEFKAVCRSESVPVIQQHQVLIGDSLGEMLVYCGLANIAYVGGSLIERGGHNPLEPLACGVPVIMGPSYYNFADITQKFVEQEALQIVVDDAELGQTLNTWLSHPEMVAQKAEQAKRLIQANQGCVNRLAEITARLLCHR